MMEHHNTPAMVFSSSCTVYGQPDTLPVTEASPVKEAASPYGYTKQAGEIIIRDTMASRHIAESCITQVLQSHRSPSYRLYR